MDFETLFNRDVHQYIHTLTTGGPVIEFASMMLTVFIVFELFMQWSTFALDKPQPVEHISAILLILVTLLLMNQFIPVINAIWSAGDGLGRAFLHAATGNSDPLYLAKWFDHSMALVSPLDVGIGDTMTLIALTFFLDIVLFVLTIMMYLVGIWAVWGLALAKLLALLFIPCLAWKPARPFFTKWVEFLLSFVLLMLLLRVSGALAALAMQSAFNTMGAQCQLSAGHLCNLTHAVHIDDTSAQTQLLVSGVLSILLVGSAFKFAQAFSSASGAMSQRAQAGFHRTVKHIHNTVSSASTDTHRTTATSDINLTFKGNDE